MGTAAAEAAAAAAAVAEAAYKAGKEDMHRSNTPSRETWAATVSHTVSIQPARITIHQAVKHGLLLFLTRSPSSRQDHTSATCNRKHANHNVTAMWNHRKGGSVYWPPPIRVGIEQQSHPTYAGKSAPTN